MKRLPILVVESRPMYMRRTGYQRTGCQACVLFQDNKCKEAFHLPNETSMPCLSGIGKTWGGHYEWSQHKISVSRNKREGKFAGKDGRGERHRVGHNTRIVALGGKLGSVNVILERELTYDQAYNTMYPPRERQAKHAQWGRGRG